MPTVTKKKFAEMVNRTPAAVSQWIAAGKIHGEALVGEGRHAQINVEVALRQLNRSLDLGQQLAQPLPLLGERRSPAPDVLPGTDDQARLLRARADKEELALRIAQAEADELAGTWMVREDAEAAWSAHLATLAQSMETWLVTSAAPECVAAVTAGDGVKDVAKLLRDGFRGLRQRLADAAEQRCPAASGTAEEADLEDVA